MLTTWHSEPSSSNAAIRKCGRCGYEGPETTFPFKRNGGGYLKTCKTCTDRQIVRKNNASAMVGVPATDGPTPKKRGNLKHQPPMLPYSELLERLKHHQDQAFDMDYFVTLEQGTWSSGDNLHQKANKLRDMLGDAAALRWNQKKTRKAANSSVVTYYCSKLDGEQTNHGTKENSRRPARPKMRRYKCGGWLHITIINNSEELVRIRMVHAHPHPRDEDDHDDSIEDLAQLGSISAPPAPSTNSSRPERMQRDPTGSPDPPEWEEPDVQDANMMDDMEDEPTTTTTIPPEPWPPATGPPSMVIPSALPAAPPPPPPPLPVLEPVYFSEGQIAHIKHNFDILLSLASGMTTSHTTTPRDLVPLFDQIERIANQVVHGRENVPRPREAQAWNAPPPIPGALPPDARRDYNHYYP